MFQRYQFTLENPLTKLQIPTFSHLFLQHVRAYKVSIDPIERKKVTVFYVRSTPLEKVTKEIDYFLHHIFVDGQREESGLETVDVPEPPMEMLCSCSWPVNHTNISDQLLEQRWVTLLREQELGFSQDIVRLMDLFDRTLVEYVGKHVGAYEERLYSVFLPTYYVEKMNYFQSAPLHLFFASHLSHDQDELQKFSLDVKTHEGKLPKEASHFMEKPSYVLQSAPCFKVYFELENQVLQQNLIYSVKGLCFRNEAKATYLLERLLNFHQREFVFVGSKEHVLTERDHVLQRTIEWMQLVGIKGECKPANDPFFLSDDMKRKYRVPSRVKYELRADIPYKQDSISIASFDTHGDYFAQTFNITHATGEEVWSGCMGVGLERCVWSFLQQYGLQKEQWPAWVTAQLP